MLSTLRRGSRSLPQILQSASHTTRATRTSNIKRDRPFNIQKNCFRHNVRAFSHSALWRQEAAIAVEQEASDPILEFQELESRNLVHPAIIRTITQDMKLSKMTDVQTATINEALNGDDLSVICLAHDDLVLTAEQCWPGQDRYWQDSCILAPDSPKDHCRRSKPCYRQLWPEDFSKRHPRHNHFTNPRACRANRCGGQTNNQKQWSDRPGCSWRYTKVSDATANAASRLPHSRWNARPPFGSLVRSH